MRFDPLEFERDREVIPDEYPQSGAITGRRSDTGGETDEGDGPGVEYGNVLDRIDTLANQTFRVQLFTSKLYGKAQRARTIAEEIFDRPVFVDYEVPYFKVRVGSFFDRDQAEDYQQRARAAGYDNAWVVMVNLGTRTSPPLYDSLAPETGDTYRGDFGPSDDE
jgi:hypothetical protein